MSVRTLFISARSFQIFATEWHASGIHLVIREGDSQKAKRSSDSQTRAEKRQKNEPDAEEDILQLSGCNDLQQTADK